VVGIVIEKVLTGVRTWDPVRNPDLDAFLESVVDSELSHLVESWEHRHVRTAAAFSAPEQLGQEIGQGSSSADGPLEKAVAGEEAIRRAEFFDSFHASLADDPVLQGIVACIHEDVVKPGEIAVRLGIPVTEIYNRRKQLQRRLTAFYADWNRARPADDWQPGRTSWRMTK
jgi:hypothetical protein